MPYITIREPIIDNLAEIETTVYNPVGLSQEHLKNFTYVAEFSGLQPKFGKDIKERYNVVTKKVVGEYVDRPLTENEKFEMLELSYEENEKIKQENELLKKKQKVLEGSILELTAIVAGGMPNA
jgi:hypothetical protein